MALKIFLTIILTAGLWGFTWYTTKSLAGEAPQMNYAEYMAKNLAVDIPSDINELKLQADKAFENKEFKKALVLYSSILNQNPEDSFVRAKYASTLTFVGQVEEAIKELNIIIANEPDNFHAHAYLSIAYAQANQINLAIKEGELAIPLAPSEAAKERFRAFLETLKKPADSILPKAAQVIVDAVKSNPIAGSKIVDAKLNEDSLELYFREFPMQSMPEAAKSIFYQKIKAAAQVDQQFVKKVVFVDSATNNSMDSLSLE